MRFDREATKNFFMSLVIALIKLVKNYWDGLDINVAIGGDIVGDGDGIL